MTAFVSRRRRRWEDGGVGEAEAHVLYGRQFSRWWDVVAGVRQDFQPVHPERGQRWASRASRRTGSKSNSHWLRWHFRHTPERRGRIRLLLTSRLVLQPLLEVDLYGKSDPERGIGVDSARRMSDCGCATNSSEFAPYIGVTWNNKWGQTGDFAKAAGEDTGGARFVSGASPLVLMFDDFTMVGFMSVTTR